MRSSYEDLGGNLVEQLSAGLIIAAGSNLARLDRCHARADASARLRTLRRKRTPSLPCSGMPT